MPGSITHLMIAYHYIEEYGFTDEEIPSILLGSIAPDSVNLKGHAPKEVRWASHLRNADLDQWLDNAKNFFERSSKDALTIGYLLHIVTDIVWDKYFDTVVYQALLKRGVPKESLKLARWHEFDRFENEQHEKEWYKKSLTMLENAKKRDFHTISEKQMSDFCQYVIERDKVLVSSFGIIDNELFIKLYAIVSTICGEIIRKKQT